MSHRLTIAVVGLWHLGEVYAASLAQIGHTVIGVDQDPVRIASFRKNIPPLAEPSLAELIADNQKNGRLSFSEQYSSISESDVVWFTLDTPVDEEDRPDVQAVFLAVKAATMHLKQGVVIGVSSQIPAGSSAQIQKMIIAARPGLAFSYFYSPENLRLGAAVECFMNPGRVVVGADTDEARTIARTIFKPLPSETVCMSVASAEMTKHALNAFLATSISFTNDLADACEAVGADVEDVIAALRSDERIGKKAYLFAGLGFAGGTLGRDLRALLSLGKEWALNLPVISAVYEKNSSRVDAVQTRITTLLGTLKGKTVTILGVAYKPGTSTLRRSQALQLEEFLRSHGAQIRLSDPLAISSEVAERTPTPFFRDPMEALSGADLAIVMSPIKEYRNLDPKAIKKAMGHPFLFDACNILAPVESSITDAGVTYERIGK